ncbi:MAG: hypothetical protein ACLTDM_11190 [Clostridium butyricum]
MKKTYIENYDGLCFKCLQKKESVKNYQVPMRGYGSIFDCSSPLIQVCDDCKCDNLERWVYEEDCNKNNKLWYEKYKYETNIEKYVKTFPVEGQELFFNRTMEGAFYKPLPSQDWIDIELGVAPDEVYLRNKLYTPSEIKAYYSKYPTCGMVYNKIYSDNSMGSECFCSAHGDFGGKCGINICSDCYSCSYYQPRANEIQTFLIDNNGNSLLIPNEKAIAIYKFVKRTKNRQKLYEKRKKMGRRL